MKWASESQLRRIQVCLVPLLLQDKHNAKQTFRRPFLGTYTVQSLTSSPDLTVGIWTISAVMSNQRRSSVPIRSFGSQGSGLGDDTSEAPASTTQRILGRISFGSFRHRPSFLNRVNEQDSATPTPERAPIPTMMQPSSEVYTTPLPILSMIVLSIVSFITSSDILA